MLDVKSLEQQGRDAGEAAASWVTDGNTTDATYRWILKGIAEGDPEIMDLQPACLSGEWAGESIPEIIYGYNDMTDEDAETACDAYEAGFSQGFWDTLERACRACVADGSEG